MKPKINILSPVHWENKKHLVLWYALFQVLMYLILPLAPALYYLILNDFFRHSEGIGGLAIVIFIVLAFILLNVLKHFAQKIQPTSVGKRNIKFGVEMIFGIATCVMWIVLIRMVVNGITGAANIIIVCLVCKMICVVIETLFIKPLGVAMDVRSEAERSLEVDAQKAYLASK